MADEHLSREEWLKKYSPESLPIRKSGEGQGDSVRVTYTYDKEGALVSVTDPRSPSDKQVE